MKTKTTARVTLSLEVTVVDTRGPDCPMSQVHRQAIASALATVGRVTQPNNVRVVGAPTVTATTVEVTQ